MKAFHLAIALGLLLAPQAGWAQELPKEIAITAKRYEFTPKEVHLKKGETVTLVLKSVDVTHGLMSKKLMIDADLPPNKEVRVTVTPRSEGRFVAICDHFCGFGHGGMKMVFIVE